MSRSPRRRHDKTSFFKYVSASTARTVLVNHALRWSSPILFNDPFDVPREILFGMTSEELSIALENRFISLIESPPEDTSNFQQDIKNILDNARNGMSAEQRLDLINNIRNASESRIDRSDCIESFRDKWRHLIPEFRILCLTESPAHTAMWFHYADKYKGAVLEFKCSDELDSVWLTAKPVTYPTTKPDIYSADGWAKLMLLPNDIGLLEVLDISTYTKSPDWSYEGEWRNTTFKRPNETGLFTDYAYNPLELSSIYLGPQITSMDREALLLVAANYPHANIYEVSISMNREFIFNKVRD